MDIKLPNLGEGADSGTVVSVFVKEGEVVAKDQPILELENEKAVASIPSTAGGKVSKVHVKAGDKISVGARLITLSAEASQAPAASAERDEQRAQVAPEPEQEAEQAGAQEGTASAPAAASQPTQRSEPEQPFHRNQIPGIPVAAAPSLRKTARDVGIDLSKVRGTGRGGRICLEDVRAYVQRLQKLASEPRVAAGSQPAQAPAAPPKPAVERIDFSKWGSVTKQPLTPLRQVIARRMLENWNAVPHVTQFADADITALNALRKKYAAGYESKGAKLTLTVFAIKAVTDTLKKHPVFNSSLDEATQELVLKQYYHIGIAVDTEAGLIVPVLRDADQKSLLDLARELEQLAAKARDRKVSGEDLKGGTFTISNQGGIGGAHFTPIVNKPEVAILGLGRGAMQPMVRGDQIEPRLILPIGLSYDHRVIDGGIAARFTVDLIQAFEQFSEDAVKI